MTLRWIWPLFVAYLISVAVTPTPYELSFGRTLGLPDGIVQRVSAIPMLEHIAAMTVFGFLLA